MPATEVMALLLLGLVAGALGGMVGVGGSIVIIPFLTVLLHRDQQLSQAAAMIINVFVAVPSMIRHHRAGAVRWPVAWRMLPAGAIGIVLGVVASNALAGEVLEKLYGVFLLSVVAWSTVLLVRGEADGGDPAPRAPGRADWGRVSATGGAMGVIAGLLGIGGGPVAIPLLQRLCGLSLRQSIATATAVMCMTAAVGAASKNATLHALTGADGAPLRATDSLLLAACLAPTAVLGALVGAGLTHALPIRGVRLAFTLLMAWACTKMLGLL